MNEMVNGVLEPENADNSRRIAAVLVVMQCLAASIFGQSSQASAKYKIDRANSFFLAVTDKTGVFSFAAHRHGILATEFSVDLSIDRSELKRSSVTITIPVSSLVIDSDEARRKANLSGGPGQDDIQKIQKRILSPEVLDAAIRRSASSQVPSPKVEGTNCAQRWS